MIVVMAYGYARKRQPSLTSPESRSVAEYEEAMQDMAQAFEDERDAGAHPVRRRDLRDIADRDTAHGGLSMGGMQTFQITLNHLDLFSWIGGFSERAGCR